MGRHRLCQCSGGRSGLEYGTALATAVDGRGFKLVSTIEIDTNGTWGWSHPSPSACDRVSVAAGQLTILDAPANCVTTTTTVLPKADNDPNGMEYGTYSYNVTSKEFKVLSVLVDTNGCAGLNDTGGGGMASFSFTLSSDGKFATVVFSDSTDQFFRVSR